MFTKREKDGMAIVLGLLVVVAVWVGLAVGVGGTVGWCATSFIAGMAFFGVSMTWYGRREYENG